MLPRPKDVSVTLKKNPCCSMWTREAVRAAALELNASDAQHVRAVLVSTISSGDTPALLSALHLLDQAMKLAPVLIPVVRSVLVGTALPAACQELLAHWAALRLVPAVHPPRYGYFYWQKLYQAEQAGRGGGGDASPTTAAAGPPAWPLAGADCGTREACSHCNDPFEQVFSDAQNAWALADAARAGNGLLYHVDCTPEARRKWMQ